MKNRIRESVENKHTSGFIGSGFLLGFLLGILLTLLVTTKRGREILRELMDKVIEKIGELDAAKTTHQEGSAEESDYVKPPAEDVKREIRYLAAELKDEQKESADKEHTDTRKLHVEDNDSLQESISDSQSEHHANGKSKPEKLTRRLFFRRTQSKA